MTRNQIEFWKLNESQRANMQAERLNQQIAAETKRANLAREAEIERANRAAERQKYLDYGRQTRYDEAQLLTTARRNQADKEHQLRQTKLESMKQQYERLKTVAEQNLSSERNRIQSSYNTGVISNTLKQLEETRRSNQASESIRRYQNVLNRQANTLRSMELSEQRRYNNLQQQLGYYRANLDLIGSLSNTFSRSASTLLQKGGVKR